jgi:hypothetical protein
MKKLAKTWLVDNSRVKKSNKHLLKDYILYHNSLVRDSLV